MENNKISIHHYTDLNAMISILGKQKIFLRATNFLYLNDTRELLEGIEVVNKMENRDIPIESFQDYYLTSFSHAEDNLSMWGMYAANGSGCILSFDKDIITSHYMIVAECTYGEENIQNDLKNFLNLTNNGSLTNIDGPQPTKNQHDDIIKHLKETLIATTCLQAKNEAFTVEKEIRGIVHCDKRECIRFRVKNNVVIPYVELGIPKEALKSITIGPTSNSDLTKQSIRHFLKINGYDLAKVEIKESKVPYRG